MQQVWYDSSLSGHGFQVGIGASLWPHPVLHLHAPPKKGHETYNMCSFGYGPWCQLQTAQEAPVMIQKESKPFSNYDRSLLRQQAPVMIAERLRLFSYFLQIYICTRL